MQAEVGTQSLKQASSIVIGITTNLFNVQQKETTAVDCLAFRWQHGGPDVPDGGPMGIIGTVGIVGFIVRARLRLIILLLPAGWRRRR